MKKSFLLFVCLILLASCGSIENVSPEDDVSANQSGSISLDDVYLFGTDYMSSGQLFHSTNTFNMFSNTGVTGLGSSAAIHFFEDSIYVLHDGFSQASYNNIQVINPTNLQTTHQFSTGSGTNPHDVVVKGDVAFISLYSPEGDPAVVDEEGNPADILVMNLNNGSTIKGLSFAAYLNDDGAKTSRADQMVRVGNKIYVCLQDLNGDFFEHNAQGLIGVIDIDTQTIEKVYPLKGRNPADIVYSAQRQALFVAVQAPYDFILGNFDLATDFGGIEIVPLNGSETTLLADEELGGYIERLAVGANAVFVVASQFDTSTFFFSSKILKMPAEISSASEATEFIGNNSDVREIAVDGKDQLWVSRRVIQEGAGSASDPQIDVFNTDTGQSLTPSMKPTVPVTSITFSY